MKHSLLPLAAFAAMVLPASGQLVTLQLLDDAIVVGDTFDIAVELQREAADPAPELLSFAFDTNTSATVSFLGASVAAAFGDESALIPYDVGGSAFPGVTETSFTLVVLSFRALAQDEGWVSVLGPVDNFGGLKYTTFVTGDDSGFFIDEDYPIDAMVVFDIGEGEGIIPEPSLLGLLSFVLVVGLVVWRGRR